MQGIIPAFLSRILRVEESVKIGVQYKTLHTHLILKLVSLRPKKAVFLPRAVNAARFFPNPSPAHGIFSSAVQISTPCHAL